MKQAVAYARVSVDRGGNAASVEEQLAEIGREAERRGWALVEQYVDRNVSASKPGTKRPAYLKLIDDVRAGRVVRLLVYMTDRLYRQPRELEDLIDLVEGRGVQIGTVRSGELDLSIPEGRAYARNAATWNKLESEKISERVRRTKAARRTEGLDLGGGRRRFGYQRRLGNGWEVDSVEAELIREVAGRVISGEAPTRISSDLNERGVRTAGGGRWRPSHVRRMLIGPSGTKRGTPFLLGGKNWRAILTEDEVALARARLAEPSKLAPKSAAPTGRRYALTGILECCECGTKLRGSGGYYRCGQRDGGCGKVGTKARDLEDMLSLAVQREREAGRERDPVSIPPAGDPEERAELLRHLREAGEQVEALSRELEVARPGTTRYRAIMWALDRLQNREVQLSSALAFEGEGPRLGRWTALADPAELAAVEDLERRWHSGKLTQTELIDLHDMFAAYFERVCVKPRVRQGERRGAGLDPQRVMVAWRGR